LTPASKSRAKTSIFDQGTKSFARPDRRFKPEVEMEVAMRMLIGTVLALVLTAGGASAQDTPAPGPISPAQEVRIRAFVASENRTSVAVPASFRLAVRAEIPQSADLYEFEEDLGLGQHRYTIISGRTVIVDPSTRKIVSIID
jgi:hypothetical protein